MKDAKGHGSDARGGGLPTTRLDNAGSRQPKTGYLATPTPKYGANPNAARTAEGGKLTTAASEQIAKGRAADEGRTIPISDRMVAAALGQGHPKSNSVPLGSSFAAAKTDLWFGRNVAMGRGADNRRKS